MSELIEFILRISVSQTLFCSLRDWKEMQKKYFPPHRKTRLAFANPSRHTWTSVRSTKSSTDFTPYRIIIAFLPGYCPWLQSGYHQNLEEMGIPTQQTALQFAGWPEVTVGSLKCSKLQYENEIIQRRGLELSEFHYDVRHNSKCKNSFIENLTWLLRIYLPSQSKRKPRLSVPFRGYRKCFDALGFVIYHSR